MGRGKSRFLGALLLFVVFWLENYTPSPGPIFAWHINLVSPQPEPHRLILCIWGGGELYSCIWWRADPGGSYRHDTAPHLSMKTNRNNCREFRPSCIFIYSRQLSGCYAFAYICWTVLGPGRRPPGATSAALTPSYRTRTFLSTVTMRMIMFGHWSGQLMDASGRARPRVCASSLVLVHINVWGCRNIYTRTQEDAFFDPK